MIALCRSQSLQVSSSSRAGLTTSACQARPLLCQAAAHRNLCSTHHSNHSSSSSAACSSNSRRVTCHAVDRPMWARGSPEPASDRNPSGSAMSAMRTKEVISCNSVPELETVFVEHGSSFDYINAAAAITKYAKLPGSSMRSPFFSRLAGVWLNQLPEAGEQGCANVLWACSKLGSAEHPVWAKTWQAFLKFAEHQPGATGKPLQQAQHLSNVLYACAKLRKQPQQDELLLLLEAFLQPDVLAAAAPQAIANVIWSVGLLSSVDGWQAELSQELLQELLAPQPLEKVAVEGAPQAISNVLVGLGRMRTGLSPLLIISGGQEHARQLLSGVQLSRVRTWRPQDITNSMWALGELQLRHDDFLHVAVDAAPSWLPQSDISLHINQAATACAQLQYRDERFMALLLQRAQQLLWPRGHSRGRSLSAADRASMAAICCITVAQLHMRGLAAEAHRLVADSDVGRQDRSHPSNLRRLFVFHSWLFEQQLLDGKGLAGLLTKKQLQQGAQEVAAWGEKAFV